MNSIRIWCSYHRLEDLENYNLKDSDILKLYYTNDNTLKEDNINYLNKYLSEIVTYYYVWKNNIKSDIVGFCHYRRHFNTINYEQILNGHPECYMTFYIKPESANYFFEENSGWGMNVYDANKIINLFSDFIKLKDNIDFNDYLQTHDIIKFSNKISYILKWDQFDNICSFIFGFLGYINKVNNVNWKNNIIEFENTFRNANNQLKIDTEWTRELSVLLEFFIALYINIIYDTIDDENKYAIISCIDNKDILYKLYRKNIKTGIRHFYNFSKHIKIMEDYDCQYLKCMDDYKNISTEIKNITKRNVIPIILKDNEYIECKDSFEFNKGNYTIKQYENN